MQIKPVAVSIVDTPNGVEPFIRVRVSITEDPSVTGAVDNASVDVFLPTVGTLDEIKAAAVAKSIAFLKRFIKLQG